MPRIWRGFYSCFSKLYFFPLCFLLYRTCVMYTHYSLRIKAGEFEISLGFKEAFLKHFYKVFFSVENSY